MREIERERERENEKKWDESQNGREIKRQQEIRF